MKEENKDQELIEIDENKEKNEYQGYLIKVEKDNYLMIPNCEITKKMIDSNQEIDVELIKCTLPKIKININKDKHIENIKNVSFIKLPKDKYDENFFINEDNEILNDYRENINLLKKKLYNYSKYFLILLALVLTLILIFSYFLFFRSKKEYDSEEDYHFNTNVTWPKKRKRGKGIINYHNGYRFEGNFKKGKAQGEGIVYDGNGDVLVDGNFSEGVLNNGTIYQKYYIYSGQFKNGTFDKYGTYNYINFDKNILKEKNFYSYNGVKYSGNWENGEKSGEGTMVYEYDKSKKNKKYYVGEWKNDKKNGRGKLYYGNSDYYDGSWENNAKHGSGKIYKNGKLVFEGNWVNDKKSGKGISYNEKGMKLYEGEWLNDKKNGEGKLFYEDGDYYEGNFVNDKRHGEGKVISKGKIVCSGNFVEDKYQYGESETEIKHC